MEIRTIEEVKVYKLILNPMRGHTEGANLVACSYYREKLVEWYSSLLAPEVVADVGTPSFDCHGDSHKWHKAFIIGSELEWYNPCNSDFLPNHFNHGISEEWVSQEVVENSGVKIIY